MTYRLIKESDTGVTQDIIVDNMDIVDIIN